eukprot:3407863-Pyramimonas_sp.AAC.1
MAGCLRQDGHQEGALQVEAGHSPHGRPHRWSRRVERTPAPTQPLDRPGGHDGVFSPGGTDFNGLHQAARQHIQAGQWQQAGRHPEGHG